MRILAVRLITLHARAAGSRPILGERGDRSARRMMP
jgi:hypothetical protein